VRKGIQGVVISTKGSNAKDVLPKVVTSPVIRDKGRVASCVVFKSLIDVVCGFCRIIAWYVIVIDMHYTCL